MFFIRAALALVDIANSIQIVLPFACVLQLSPCIANSIQIVLPFACVLQLSPCTAYNPCGSNNGNCSDLCLLSALAESGFTCVCPEGQEMDESMRSCGRFRLSGANT